MSYLGNLPTYGDTTSNFKILDDIASYTETFDGSSVSVVSVGNDTLTFNDHRFITGQRVTYSTTGTAIGGLTSGTAYYIIKNDQNTIKLATSLSNANNNIAIDLSALGTGTTHTLNVAFDGINTKFKATYDDGTKAFITRAAQLQISINGVIQQPQDTTTPANGFGIDLDAVIVFSTPPVNTDVFWGNVIANSFAAYDISDNELDTFTGNGSTVEFNLSRNPPDNNSVLVTIDGVVQYPTEGTTVRAYSVYENKITFTAPPGNNTAIQVRHIGFAGAVTSNVTGFYGRTGNVVLTSQDNVNIGNVNSTGIGTFNNVVVGGATTALIVSGNARITGILTVGSSSITLDGSNNQVNVGTGVTLHHTNGVQVGGNTVHSTGITVNQMNVTGVVTATTFSGNLNSTGVTTVTTLNVGTGGTIITTTAGGNVGIGTTNPGANKVEIVGSSGGIGLAINNNSAIGFKDINGTSRRVALLSSASNYYYGDVDNAIPDSNLFLLANSGVNFILNGTTRARVSSDSITVGAGGTVITTSSNGFVGIGTTNPTQRLHIQDGSENIRITGTAIEQNTTSGLTLNGSNASGFIVFRTAGDERARITSSGNLGIGLTNPAAKNTTHVTTNDDGIRVQLQKTPNSGEGPRLIFGHSTNNGTQQIFAAIKSKMSSGNDATWFSDLGFYTGGSTLTQNMTLKYDGGLLIGHTDKSGSGTRLETSSTSSTDANIALIKRDSGTANQDGQNLFFYNLGPASTARNDNTSIGSIRFYASQPTSGSGQEAAGIYCTADGQQTGIYVPSKLTFYTAGTSSTSAIERLRITTDGNIALPGRTFVRNGSNTVITASGSYLECTGYKESNASSFAMFDIVGMENHTTVSLEIEHSHNGGGSHGSWLRWVGALNAYTDIIVDYNSANNYGGGLGFTISRPQSNTLRVTWNGANSFASSFYLRSRIWVGRNQNTTTLFQQAMDSFSSSYNYY